MSKDDSQKSNTGWYIAAVVVIVVIIVIGVLAYELSLPYANPSPSSSPTPSVSPTPTPTTSPTPTPSGSPIALTLYAGSVSSSTLGFGNTADNITSPGPTLSLKSGQTYTMTVHNVATDLAHSWEIVTTKAISSSPLFGAGIDINTYIQPGQSGSVTFTPNQTGSFYYVCTVPGHIQLGMWGIVEIT
jgi:FtsP/CotA-like multicopper oxidase with cupredoxin domain